MRYLVPPQGAPGGGGTGIASITWSAALARIDPDASGVANGSPSCVVLGDGRVLFVYVRGGSVYGAYASSLTAFLTVAGAATGEFQIVGGLTKPRATAFAAPSGTLYLAYAYTDDGTSNAAVKILKATASDGSAWTAYATVDGPFATAGLLSEASAVQQEISVPYFAPGGRWVLVHPHFYQKSPGGLYAEHAVSTSGDGGVTWTQRLTVQISPEPDDFNGRSVVAFGSQLWVWIATDFGNGTGDLYTSTDGGTSWALAWSVTGTGYSGLPGYKALLAVDAGRFYFVIQAASVDTLHVWDTTVVPAGAGSLVDTGVSLTDPHLSAADTGLVFCPTPSGDYVLMQGDVLIFAGDSVWGIPVVRAGGGSTEGTLVQGVLAQAIAPQAPQ